MPLLAIDDDGALRFEIGFQIPRLHEPRLVVLVPLEAVRVMRGDQPAQPHRAVARLEFASIGQRDFRRRPLVDVDLRSTWNKLNIL